MNKTLLRLLMAATALLFVAAACAGDTGATWTFAPVTVAVATESDSGEAAEETITDVEAADTTETADTEAPAEAEAAEATGAPAEAEAAEATGAPAEAEAATGEARVIDLVATGALQFTTPDGTQLIDIAVTPGETVVFRVDNTANFPHNFYIGDPSDLSVPTGTTDTGIADWSLGVQEVEWVVPDDVSGLQFACTVPGHYALMQGTFSISDEVPADAPDGGDDATATGEARVIELAATGEIQFTTPDGTQLTDIAVTPGETVVFRVDNTAGFPHSFYIGEPSEVSVAGANTDVGIPEWSSGVQEVEWVVPDDVSGLEFACTVPGHYSLMHGTFEVSA